MFRMDSRFMQFLGRVMDLVILNLCFIVSCLPVITAGAGLTALYSINLKMVRNEEAYVFKDFWKSFKSNFKQSTLLWLLFLLVGFVLFVDYKVIPTMPTDMSKVFQVAWIVLLFLYFLMMTYVFPYIARFEDKQKIVLKNAFLMGASHIGYSLLMMAIPAVAIVITIYNLASLLVMVFLWILLGFSLISFVNSFFLRKIFGKYEGSNELQGVE